MEETEGIKFEVKCLINKALPKCTHINTEKCETCVYSTAIYINKMSKSDYYKHSIRQ